jgi:NitT/TauT family transport system permease protein
MNTPLWYLLPKNLRVTLILISAFLVWQFAVTWLKVPAVLVPSPVNVVQEIWNAPTFYLLHTIRTLQETIVGFGIAVILGVLLSVLVVSSRFLEETIYVLLIAVNAIPKVAVAPLFVVWLGTDLMPKYAISATIAVFVIVIDLVLGFRSVERDKLDLARSLKGSRLQTLWLIRFPEALPHLFAGMKNASTLALIGAIVGEFVASDRGLGYVIMLAQGSFETVRIFAAIAILSLVGTLLFFMVEWAERLCLPWHASARNAYH